MNDNLTSRPQMQSQNNNLNHYEENSEIKKQNQFYDEMENYIDDWTDATEDLFHNDLLDALDDSYFVSIICHFIRSIKFQTKINLKFGF